MDSSYLWRASLGRFMRLSGKDRRLLLEAIVLLPAIHGALMLLGYTRLKRGMEKMFPFRTVFLTVNETDRFQRAQEIASIVSIAAQHGVYKASCLRRSLLTWWFLRLEEINGQICFGVRMVNQRLEAHAWVEYHGRIVNDSQSVRSTFRVLEDVIPPTRQGL
jgi:hypothetical protein